MHEFVQSNECETMAIHPDRTKAKVHKFTAYDFEWRSIEVGIDLRGQLVKSLHLLWAGAFDERGYRGYRTIREFVRGELIPRNSDRRYYAHFGGAADMVFLLQELAKLDPASHTVTGAFSGSSAICVQVETSRCRWLFLDSYWTMRAPLREIGEWLGFPKGDCNVQTAGMGEIIDYNERDCRVLHEGIRQFQDTILELGGELGITAASTALITWRKRFLKRLIKNGPRFDEYAEPSYVASRVEKIRDRCDNAVEYDINSCFPYAFTKGTPGSPERFGKRIPDDEKTLWIADCTVSVPDQYLPPLPYRTEDRVFFPTGRWRTRITSADRRCGDFKIEKVHSCQTYETRWEHAEFAEVFYALRKRSGLYGKVVKIVLNGLYGKHGESRIKDMLVLRPDSRQRETSHQLAAGIYVQEIEKDVPHAHVAISSIVTAEARRALRDYGKQVLALGGMLYYFDTDAFICSGAELPTGLALGELKKEAVIESGEILTQKSYALQLAPKDWNDGYAATLEEASLAPLDQTVRAKGFSKVLGTRGDSQRLDYQGFCNIRDGYALEVERMSRIKELIAETDGGADYIPSSVIRAKSLRGEALPKRRATGDNDSLPWTVSELRERLEGEETPC